MTDDNVHKLPSAHERLPQSTQVIHERVTDLLMEAAELLQSDGVTQERAWLELAVTVKNIYMQVRES